MDDPRLILITGARQVGKSTLCQRLVEHLREAGVQVTGLATQHTGEHDLAVTELATGARYSLTLPFAAAEGVRLGRFRMDPEALGRSSRGLAASFPTQIVILDEIGPLELVQRQGWVGAFDLLAHAAYARAFVVVRPELLSEAMQAFGESMYTVVYVTERNRDRLVHALVNRTRRACQVES